MKCLRWTWKGGEVKDRGAWDECSWTVGRWWWKITAAAAIWWWTMMKSRTIYVGTRRAERGAEQEDKEDGRLSTSTASLQSWFLKKKKQTAVLISGSNQVLIPENVVETLVKITGEDCTPLCFVCEYDQLWNMPTLYCLFMAMNNCLLYIHMDL